LLGLSGTSGHIDFSQLALHLLVADDLQAAHVFLLHGPETLFFFFHVSEHFLFLHLLLALVKNGLLLLLVHSLEMVGLDAVRGQHAHFSLRVFRHEVVVQGKVLLDVTPHR